mgnify:CR=1 FL=1
MAKSTVSYLVFDVESVADGELVAAIRYPDDDLSAADAITRYRQELMEEFNRDFIPYTFQFPISVVAAKVSKDFLLTDLVVLDAPKFRPHIIARDFWKGWEAYSQPTLVSFNGRTFDMPLLELAALRYGISAPTWFAEGAKSYDSPRNRYQSTAHLDLQDLLTNYGASRFYGGLNLAANLLGKPGKMSVQGDMVQDMYDEGRIEEINDYCRCDVLDTYFVFLRSRVIVGRLPLEREQEIVAQVKEWLIDQSDEHPVYQRYLDEWGNWSSPWDD